MFVSYRHTEDGVRAEACVCPGAGQTAVQMTGHTGERSVKTLNWYFTRLDRQHVRPETGREMRATKKGWGWKANIGKRNQEGEACFRKTLSDLPKLELQTRPDNCQNFKHLLRNWEAEKRRMAFVTRPKPSTRCDAAHSSEQPDQRQTDAGKNNHRKNNDLRC